MNTLIEHRVITLFFVGLCIFTLPALELQQGSPLKSYASRIWDAM
jgi:hypothetical protein